MVYIRARTPEDLDALVAVAARVRDVDNYPSELSRGGLARFLTRPEPTTAWVAVADDTVVGHVALNRRPSPAAMQLVEAHGPELPPVFVARLLVDPGRRRQGVGQLLLTHAQREGRTAGSSVFLEVVDTAGSAAAIRLYRRAGWEIIGRVPLELAGDTVEELVFRAPPL